MTTPLRTLGPAVLLAVVITGGLAGCSGDPDPAASSPARQPTLSGSTPGTAPLPPAATTPVPPPTAGSTSQTVAPRPVRSKKPVKIDQTAQPEQDVTVTVPELKSVEAKAQGPGEVSGPALEVHVEVQNATDRELDLSGAAVTLTAADDSPGQIMTGPPTALFPASVAAGAKAEGVFVFTVAKDQRDPVRVDVLVDPDHDVVAFRGRAPR